jgi:hypothetical protein
MIDRHPTTRCFVSAHRWCVRAAVVVLGFGFLGIMTAPAAAQSREYALKTAYLYNFTRFVSWPHTALPGEPNFVIGVLGENPFGRTLDALAKKKRAQGKRIEVRYFSTLADYRPSHILFVASDATLEIQAAIIRQTRGQPVLLVGESPGFGRLGGTANFVLTEADTVGIEMNIDALNRRALQAKAALLKLAKIVRDEGAE